MVANLTLGSFLVEVTDYGVPIGFYHSYIIYDANIDGDNDYETNSGDVKILRGGFPATYDTKGVSVEALQDVELSIDWEAAKVASNLTPLNANWQTMWDFAPTMGSQANNAGVYDTESRAGAGSL
jgi:hypothetical protein